MLELTQSSIFSRLRGLLEVTRLVRTEADVPELLSAIARTVAESLGFRTVAINLYRPEWDDFVVTTVHGREEARATLLGQVREVSDWEPLLDRRFLQRGAYLIAYGEFDWADMEAYTPDLPVPEDPDAWHPEDALLAPMRGDNGRLLGILSVDEPISGRKPRGDEMDVLVAAAEHAALAVQSAQDSSRARRHREAMTRLLEVSTRLTGVWQTDELLQLVSDAISDALGFAKVSVQLLEDTGRHETVASVGFADGENIGESLSADDLERLLQPRFELEGCYLIPHAEAGALLPTRPAGYMLRTRRTRAARVAEPLALRPAP